MESSDGLDEARWRGLCAIVVAANHGDSSAARAAVRKLASQISGGPADWQVGTYLVYLLQYRVIEILGRQPEPHDLSRLAERYRQAFSKIMVNHVDLLEKTLKLAFGFGVEGPVTGETRVVAGSATLGVMLENPQEQLQAIRPHLARWLRASMDDLQTEGYTPETR